MMRLRASRHQVAPVPSSARSRDHRSSGIRQGFRLADAWHRQVSAAQPSCASHYRVGPWSPGRASNRLSTVSALPQTATCSSSRASRHPTPLGVVALPPSSREPALLLALRPACSLDLLRRGGPHACFDESPRRLSLLPRRVWAPNTSWREALPTRLPLPARISGRVAPLQALNTPGKASPNT